MTLRVRFILAFAVTSIFAAVFGIFSLSTYNQMQKSYLKLEKVYVPTLSAVMEIRVILVNLSASVNHGIKTDKDKRRAFDAIEQLAANRDIHQKFLNYIGDSNHHERQAHDIGGDINAVISSARSFMDDSLSADPIHNPEEIRKEFTLKKERLSRHIDRLIVLHKQELKKAEAHVRRTHDRGVRFVWMGIALIMAAAGIISIFMARTILVPLGKLQQGTRIIGKGDLDYRITIKTGDEIESLADAFNSMAGHLKNHQERLIESERHAAVGVAISQIVHSIKNILLSFAAGRYFLKKALQKNDSSGLEEGFSTLDQGIKRMEDLTNDILHFSRGRALKIAPVSLNKIAAEALADVKYVAEKDKISIVFEPDPSLPLINADSRAVHTVLMNLITNAIDACGDKDYEHGGCPEIRIRSFHDPEDGISVEVSDNGPGMTDDVMEKIFTPFYSTKYSKGNGLGLSIVQKTIHEHGGEIHVSSTPGNGAAFFMKFPLNSEQSTAEA